MDPKPGKESAFLSLGSSHGVRCHLDTLWPRSELSQSPMVVLDTHREPFPRLHSEGDKKVEREVPADILKSPTLETVTELCSTRGCPLPCFAQN